MARDALKRVDGIELAEQSLVGLGVLDEQQHVHLVPLDQANDVPIEFAPVDIPGSRLFPEIGFA